MPPTPAMGPSFLPGWEAYFGARVGDTRAERGEHHEHPARAQRPHQAQADVFGGRGRVPEGFKLVPPRAQ